jgi:hypothetical protein
MSSFRWFLLLSIGLCLLVTPSSAVEQKKEEPPGFKKQYVGIFTKSSPKQQVILRQPTLRQLGDRAFLVGTSMTYDGRLEYKQRLSEDKPIIRWVALTEVIEMYEFDNINEYRDKE